MAAIIHQVATHIIINNIAPILSALVSSVYSTRDKTTIIHQEKDNEYDLDQMQMERLLPWMKLVFDDSTVCSDTQRAYKQELYNIYVTMLSDYKQYQQWRTYNNSLWIMTSYRKKNTKALAKKILTDITLFKDGLQLFSIIQ